MKFPNFAHVTGRGVQDERMPKDKVETVTLHKSLSCLHDKQFFPNEANKQHKKCARILSYILGGAP
jgi:hypothetical protein